MNSYKLANTFKIIIIGLMNLLLLNSCDNFLGNTNTISAPKLANNVLFDHVATVPVLQTSTQFALNIRNNSDTPINNIKYSANSNSIYSQATQIISADSITKCQSIPAHQSCAITITTPSFDIKDTQGSLLVSAKFLQNGINHSINRSIDYKLISNMNTSSFGISSDAILTEDKFSNNIYETIFIYNISDVAYNIQNTTLTDGTIINGAPNTINPNTVTAVNVSLTANQVLKNNAIKINTVNNFTKTQQLFTSTLQAIAINNAALVASMPSVMNTAVSTTGSFTLTNLSNNKQATGITYTVSESNISITNTCSNINANNTCTISYSLANVKQTNGNANISINYTGGTTVNIPIYWYTTASAPMFSMVAAQNPLVMQANSASITNIITVQNIGGYPTNANGLKIKMSSNTGNGQFTFSNTCENTIIGVNATCNITINSSDTISESNKSVIIQISGDMSNGNTYTRMLNITYKSQGPFYLYVTNADSNSISMYKANQLTGQLSPLATPTISTGAQPNSITTSPAGDCVYVANYQTNYLSLYSVDQSTGQLKTVGNVGSAIYINDIVSDPAGNYVYAKTNFQIVTYKVLPGCNLVESNTLSQDSFGGMLLTHSGAYLYTGFKDGMGMMATSSSGQLNFLNPSFVKNIGSYEGLAITPSDKYVYNLNYGVNTISMYKVNESTGQLTALSPATITAPTLSINVEITPSGNYLYITSAPNNIMAMYSIDQTTGQLTQLSPATITMAKDPNGIKSSPDGKFLYVANGYNSIISMYSIVQATGQLAPLSPATINTGVRPQKIAIISY